MRTVSQYVFDLAQNSIKAKAEHIHIKVAEEGNDLTIFIEDDGHGLTPNQLERVKDTFFTTRSRKKRAVGLGLALLDAACKRSGGELNIESRHRYGTKVTATFMLDNVDTPPIGDLGEVYTSCLISTQDNKILWELEHVKDDSGYKLTNRKVLDVLDLLTFAGGDARKAILDYIRGLENDI